MHISFRKRVLVCAGARPNYVKVSALLRAFSADARFEPLLLRTGQHYGDEMDAAFFRDLELPKPDFDLDVGPGSPSEQTAKILAGMAPVLRNANPNWVFVVGDVTSTIACALAARQGGVRLAHVEAGLRSFDDRMPEEWNRRAVDHISDLLFCTEESAVLNLRNEGIT